MKIIVDTNRIIAGLMKDSTCRKILLNRSFKFYVPDHLLEEIQEHRDLIKKKSGLTEETFHVILKLLIGRITVIPSERFSEHLIDAYRIIGDIDPDDVPFIALAMAIPNNGIWSEDKHFIKQNKIKIWNTRELYDMMSK